MAKICLVMIVKNEAKIIERCLNNCLSIIDAIYVSDTGSKDNTIHLIENYALQCPTKVEIHEWKNFGHNRSQSFVKAKEFIKGLEWDLKTSYALFLDADMILRNEGLDKEKLTEDSYLVKQVAGIEYYNLRLARFDLDLKCIGYTHEYWDKSSPHRLAELWIDDYNDGGSKSDKYPRDERLLLKELEEKPNNARTLFYLGETYKHMGQFKKAIEYYERRVKAGAWFEEIYYAMFQIAECYKQLKQYDDFASWSMKAYNYLPRRVESLNSLANYYRDTRNHLGCYYLSRICAETKYPDDLSLFLNPAAYGKDPYFNMSVSAYYINQKMSGLYITEISMRKYGESYRYNMILPFYIQALKVAKIISLPSQIETYHPMNPSILKTSEGYIVNLRHVNYTMNPLMQYSYSEYVYTQNVLLFFDKDLYLVETQKLTDPYFTAQEPTNTGTIRGFEDIRLYDYCDGVFKALCTSLLNSSVPSIYYLNIKDYKIEAVQKLVYPASETRAEEEHLNSGWAEKCEKNWIPLNKTADYVDIIYKYDPLEILRLKYSPLELSILSTQEVEYYFDTFRGGSACQFEKGYLVITHEVFTKEVEYQGQKGNPRVYYHRFLYLDADYKLKKSSYPFYIFNQDIEYISGMTYGHNGKIILTMGERDNKAYLLEIDPQVIKKLLFLTL